MTQFHHTRHGFRNSNGHSHAKTMLQVWCWLLARHRAGLPKPPSSGYESIPWMKADVPFLQQNRSQTTFTWLSHVSLLLQLGGLNILLDPHFSLRASPLQWLGPARKVPLPMQLAECPQIDVVLLSHNHYDHLDYHTVKTLSRQSSGSPLFGVPLGMGSWMQRQGISRVQEFDWWDTSATRGVNFHFVPAHHWSARTPFDKNRQDFKQIGERFSGFDCAALPIGAYEPRWFMGLQHVNPAEAVRIHHDVHSKLSIGVHWGTFELTDESLDEPPRALAVALQEAQVDPKHFIVMAHGETRVF